MAQVFNWQLSLDHASVTPMWSQIADGICRNLSRFRPAEGTVVVSERQLAADLKLHRNTVRQAYAELRAREILVPRNCRSLVVGPGAKNLAHKPFPMITLIFNEPFAVQLKKFSRQGLEIFGGIVERSAKLGISVNIAALPAAGAKPDEVKCWLDEIMLHSVGIINFGPQLGNEPDPVFDMLADLGGLPQVMVSVRLDDRAVSLAAEDCESGFKEAVEYLKSCGHKTLAVVEQHWELGKVSHVAVNRGTVMCRVAEEAGLKTRRFIFNQPVDDEFETVIDRFLQLNDRPTAIWCQNDKCAMKLYELLKSHGIRIPEDISLIGFDNDTGNFLSSVDYSRNELGAELVNIVWELHQHGSSETIIQKMIPSKFYKNKTVSKVTK